MPELLSGGYGVRVDVPAGYYVIGAYQRGVEVSERDFYPANGEVRGVLGADGSSVTGQVVGAEGAAISDAAVFLVPTGPGRHRIAESDQNGVYRFVSGIKPGKYRIVAAKDLPRWRWTDEATVAKLAANGIDLVLGPKEYRIAEVKVRPLQ